MKSPGKVSDSPEAACSLAYIEDLVVQMSEFNLGVTILQTPGLALWPRTFAPELVASLA